MKRLTPHTLRGRLILLILAALLMAQALSLWLFADERSAAVRTALALEAADRAANVVTVLEKSPRDMHPGILRAATSPLVRFSVDTKAEVGAETAVSGLEIQDRIRALLGADQPHDIRVDLRQAGGKMPPMPGMTGDMARMHEAMNRARISTVEMRLSVSLASGEWLNVATRFHSPVFQLAWPEAATFAVTALLLVSVLWLALGRLVRPLGRLAVSVEKFGRGEATETLSPEGPEELANLTRAFNDMHARISRFVAERTRLLGAIGHDLRSPLTALRVRAEMVEDIETSERMIATIEEMREMIEATLTFARGMAVSESAETLDLVGFVGALTSEMADSGQAVTLIQPEAPVIARARPLATRRALRNLIENAVRYGGGARITVERRGATTSVVVNDNGPGIPEADLVRVFDPFVRLEVSRSRETGGTGLGLSIARSILRAQGGDISLENRPEGGLSARLELPDLAAGR